MAATTPPPIPSELVVLKLPYPLVLHPGLLLSVTLPQKQCFGILRTALAERRAAEQSNVSSDESPEHGRQNKVSDQHPMIIACVPVLNPAGYVAERHQSISLEDCSDWGCAARILRLVHSPTTNECRLILSGLVRIRVAKARVSRVQPDTFEPATIVSAHPFFDPDVPLVSQELSPEDSRMRHAAQRLVALMGATNSPLLTSSALANVPLLPPSLLQAIASTIESNHSVSSPMLSDLLVGTLGGACEWEDRLQHLALPEANRRIEFTATMLEKAVERVQILREVLVNTPYALQDQYYGALVRSQIEAIVKQVTSMTSTGLTLRVMDNGKEASSSAATTRRENSSPGPRIIRRVIGLGPRRRGIDGPGRSDDDDDADDDADDYTHTSPGGDAASDEVKELSERCAKAQLTPEARRMCEQELRRLRRMPAQSMERGVLINYLDTMLDLPWDRITSDLRPEDIKALVPVSQVPLNGDEPLIERARQVLESDHFGLEKIKKRMLEYLAVLQLKTQQGAEQQSARTYKGPILLLVGPPGTGKTSIARSLAAALQRPFVRLSLGGVRDEAEIRGHRRTYVGALPGSIVASLRKARASDCVMLLDELDKLSSGMGVHGDPTAAMLEVLDPEQNHTFKDHYLNVPVDLSRVIFIATANSLDTIPEPLLDRVDTVHVAGYTYDEKVAIAQRHLLPKQVAVHGLTPSDVAMSHEILMTIAQSYTREAGVRTMERRIGDVVRAKAVEYAESRGGSATYIPEISQADLLRILGAPSYEPEVADEVGVPGVATGMAYQGSGMGGILHIECAFLPPGTSALKLTGSLGDVIRESAELAFAWVKTHAFALGICADRDAEFPRNDVHLHMPSGATPKDGPSAGVAFVCALVSMYLRVPLDTRLSMTGEITLRGHVTPVGGIKEKVLGAHRAGIRKMILPRRNAREYEDDVPASVKSDIDVVYVRTIQDVLYAVFGASLETQISTLHGGLEGRRRLQELDWHSRL